METLENLKIWDDVLVYDKNGLFEAILYVQRMTDNYLVIGGAKFSKTHGCAVITTCSQNLHLKKISKELRKRNQFCYNMLNMC